ncbi:MAG: hypothetical protein ACO1NO_06575 [Burkholderiaceae bacterium]
MMTYKKSVLVLALTAALSACGGGGGGGGGDSDPGANPDTGGQATLLPCINNATNQCSGSNPRTENSVTMTDSGVQVYGLSTSDRVTPPTLEERIRAALVTWGIMPSTPQSGGLAEVRLQKDGSGKITRAGLLLSDIEASWDGTTNRPPIYEIFTNEDGYPTQGRVSLAPNDPNRSLRLGPLPPSTNLQFYDWADRGAAGTQANYANNVYFPRNFDLEPIRCDGNPGCRTDYALYAADQKPVFDPNPRQWQDIGSPDLNLRQAADEYSILRYHEDGDLRAGDATPGPNGERRFIGDSGDNTGFGTSYPGFKGYRSLNNYSYQYANLANWLTTETVEIVEWVPGGGTNEHNAMRRGFVAFGDVTSPGSITSTNNPVTYRGAIYGFYAPTTIAQPDRTEPGYPETYRTNEDAEQFRGEAEITVNFNTGTATIRFIDPRTFDDAATAVPAAITVTANLGGTGTNTGPRNYFTASLNSPTDTRQGGISGRFFGPASEGIPPEISGALSFTLNTNSSTSQQTVIAGFLARKL